MLRNLNILNERYKEILDTIDNMPEDIKSVFNDCFSIDENNNFVNLKKVVHIRLNKKQERKWKMSKILHIILIRLVF